MSYIPKSLHKHFGPTVRMDCEVRGWLYSKGDDLRLKTDPTVVKHAFFFFDYGGVMAFSWVHPWEYDTSKPHGLQEDFCHKYEVIQ